MTEETAGQIERALPMTWKTWLMGIVVIGWLLWGRTEIAQAQDVDQLLDVDLARQMSHKCYDVGIAYKKAQAEHLTFEQTALALQPSVQEVRRIAQAMRHRSNRPLQLMRKYALGEPGERPDIGKACALASTYEEQTDRPALDYHSGPRK